jgi:hypothetical protein
LVVADVRGRRQSGAAAPIACRTGSRELTVGRPAISVGSKGNGIDGDKAGLDSAVERIGPSLRDVARSRTARWVQLGPGCEITTPDTSIRNEQHAYNRRSKSEEKSLPSEPTSGTGSARLKSDSTSTTGEAAAREERMIRDTGRRSIVWDRAGG